MLDLQWNDDLFYDKVVKQIIINWEQIISVHNEIIKRFHAA